MNMHEVSEWEAHYSSKHYNYLSAS